MIQVQDEVFAELIKKKRFIFWPQDITYKMIPSSYEEIKLEPCIEAQLIHILIVPNHQCHP